MNNSPEADSDSEQPSEQDLIEAIKSLSMKEHSHVILRKSVEHDYCSVEIMFLDKLIHKFIYRKTTTCIFALASIIGKQMQMVGFDDTIKDDLIDPLNTLLLCWDTKGISRE